MPEETLLLDGVQVLRWKRWLEEAYREKDEWPDPGEDLTVSH